MIEGKWHKKTREEIFRELKRSNPYVFSSHSDYSKLELFKGDVIRENCLSDADIVVFDSENNKIERIIEIENEINPKKFIGIVLATDFCSMCRIKGKNYPLEKISLQIIYRKPKMGSRKALKLKVMKKPLDNIIKKTKGSLAVFDWEEHI